MKQTAKTMLKSGISLILVLCMVLGFVPATALTAQAADEKPIIYVSIGDSMTNGYCLDGYDGESGAINYAMDTYANKFAAYLADYDGEIKDDQVIFTGDNGTVDHRQLALSGMRAEDIHWILSLDYKNEELMKKLYAFDYDIVGGNGWNSDTWYNTLKFKAGDRRTWADFVDRDYRYADAAAKILQVYNTGDNGQYFKSSYADKNAIDNAINGLKDDTYYPEGEKQANEIGGGKYLQISTEFYQKSMADADIISLAVGNTNFGTFMLNEIIDVVMSNDESFPRTYKLEEALALADDFSLAQVTAMKKTEEYKKLLAKCVSLAAGDSSKEDRIETIVEYCVASYMIGYIGMVNRILELNPDAQIIIMGLMNAYESADGTVEKDTLGELVKIVYTPMNKFLKNLPRELMDSKSAEDQAKYENAKFYYAEAPHVSCMVDVFGDDYYKNSKGNFVEYPGLLDGTEDYEINTNSIVRDRFVDEIVFGDMMFAMLPDMDVSGYDVESFEAGVAAYEQKTYVERAAFAAQDADTAKKFALYLAFENGLIRSGTENITLHSLSTLKDIGNLFMGSMPDIFANIRATSKNFYSDAAAFIASVSELTKDQVEAMLNGLETAKTAIWNADSVKPYHAALADAGHPTIEHVIECGTCMDGGDHDGMNTQLNKLLIGIAEEYKNQLDLIPYNAIVVSRQMSELLTAEQLRTMCKTTTDEAYKAALYDAVLTKAGDFTSGSDFEFKAEHIDLLLEDKGEFKLAALFVGMTEDEAGLVEKAYNKEGIYGSMMDDDQRAAIDMLKRVKAGVSQLLATGTKEALQEGAASIAFALDSAISLAYLLGLPKGMSDAMYNNTDLRGALAMNARCLLGTGAGGHPSAAGHQALYKAVLNREHIGVIYGDVNGDGEITLRDLTLLRKYLADYDYDTETSTVQVSAGADCNSDGKIDLNDLKPLREYFVN